MVPPFVKVSLPFEQTVPLSRPYDIFVHALWYLHGHGLDKGTAEAVRLLRLSTARDYTPGFYHLGRCYIKGDGVARRWPISVVELQGRVYERRWSWRNASATAEELRRTDEKRSGFSSA